MNFSSNSPSNIFPNSHTHTHTHTKKQQHNACRFSLNSINIEI